LICNQRDARRLPGRPKPPTLGCRCVESDVPQRPSTMNRFEPAPAREEDQGLRSPMLELSNAMVRLYKDAFGRGPTKARALFAGPDTLLVLLEHSMTIAERNLAALGEHERLRDARMFFQYAMEDEFRATVERILGRRTIAFVSGIDTHHDVSVEMFTLEPQSSPADLSVARDGASEPPPERPAA
jgi:uncharacterized protein YbcI